MSLVSIIIPSYNSAQYLPDSIASCLAQTYASLEIIVVDDGSKDHTREVAERYPQVKYIHQHNQGVGAARNTGLQHSTGAFIQFLDADDTLLPSKIERCLAVFTQYPETGLVYTDYELRSPDMQTPIPHETPANMPEGQVFHQLFNHTSSFFGVHCPLIRREALIIAGGFNVKLNNAADWNLWVRLAAQGVIFRRVPEALVWYRHTPYSMSKHQIAMAKDRLWAVEALREVTLPAGVDLNGKIAERHHALAFLLWQQGQTNEARTHFRKAIGLKPSMMRRLLLGLTYLTSANLAEKILQKLPV